MALNCSDWIFLRDNWVPWDQANIHVSAHALHYGSSAFEGIRAYKTDQGTAVFRLDDHIRRLFDSCKIMRMELPDFSPERLEGLCIEAVSRNKLHSCYIRPIVLRGFHSLGVNPLPCPVEAYIMVWEWGSYHQRTEHSKSGRNAELEFPVSPQSGQKCWW